MRFSNIFQLYAVAACSSQALALGTAEGQQGAAVVQRDSMYGGTGGVQHQPLERRSPSPAFSRKGRSSRTRTRTKAAPSRNDEFFDANDNLPREQANARLAALQAANPQQAGSSNGRLGRQDASRRLAALQETNPQQAGPATLPAGGRQGAPQEEQFFDASDRIARQRASARLAELQRANPQRSTLPRSGRIQSRPRFSE